MRNHRGIGGGVRRAEWDMTPASWYRRALSAGHPLTASQLNAQAIGRVINYGNPSFDFNNGPEGYAGLGMNTGIVESAGYGVSLNFASFTIPVFVIRDPVPKEKIWLVRGTGANEELRPAVEPWNALQAQFASVPMPELSHCLFAQLQAIGTDKECIVINEKTGEMWEMWGLGTFAAGPHAGEWKIGNGAYCPNLEAFSGFPLRPASALSASGLPGLGGLILHQELIEALRGEITEFAHALDMGYSVTTGTYLPPAVAADSQAFPNELQTYKNGKGEEIANPAYHQDAVPEGAMFRLQAGMHISEFEALPAGRLETTLFNTLVNKGFILRDKSGSCTFHIEAQQPMGSGYAYQPINVYAGEHVGAGAPTLAEINTTLRNAGSELHDPTLPTLTETLVGPESVLYELMRYTANDLRQIEPFSS